MCQHVVVWVLGWTGGWGALPWQQNPTRCWWQLLHANAECLDKPVGWLGCNPLFKEPRCLLSAPQRCNAERSDAQRRFLATQVISPFLQRHRCDALPCFSASPVIIFHIAHIAFPPLLPFFLSPQWFTVQNNKKFTKSHNAAMLPLATRDGHRKRKRKRSDVVHEGCLELRDLG